MDTTAPPFFHPISRFIGIFSLLVLISSINAITSAISIIAGLFLALKLIVSYPDLLSNQKNKWPSYTLGYLTSIMIIGVITAAYWNPGGNDRLPLALIYVSSVIITIQAIIYWLLKNREPSTTLAPGLKMSAFSYALAWIIYALTALQ